MLVQSKPLFALQGFDGDFLQVDLWRAEEPPSEWVEAVAQNPLDFHCF